MKEVFRVQLEGLARARGKITHARETTQALLHANALFAHRPKKARPAWVWGKDVCLYARPGPDSSLSNTEFSEARPT